MEEFVVLPEEAGVRLDAFCAAHSDLSRSAAVRLIEEGAVTVSGKTANKKTPLLAGDVVCITLPEVKEYELLPESIPLDIVYEDADLLVINKPKGMVVHPAAGNESGTLVNALLYHCGDSLSGIGGVARPGIVHRIDKDTTGLLVVAKNDAAHRALAAQLEDHSLYREYRALVQGGFREDEGTVDLPIGRHPVDRKRMAVIRDGSHGAKRAVTHYKVLSRFGSVSELLLRLETGRTHQIRVHMSAKGHPLLGDTVYGGGGTAFEKKYAALLGGQALHAERISFVHPTSKERVSFSAPLPEAFEELRAILQKNALSD
ncbi:MAG: RluA family pseudouridine synthase [Clostridia bacterium]|nr:RluA family pseudouridine synthase [Clostridia bacterium]